MEGEQHIPTRLTKAQARQLELRISFLYSRKRTGEIAELRKRITEGTSASLAYTTASCAKPARQLRKRKNQKPNKTKIPKIPTKAKPLPTSTCAELTTSTEGHLRLLSTCRSEMGYSEADFQKLESFASNIDCFDKESTKPTLAFAFPKQWNTEVESDIPAEEKNVPKGEVWGTENPLQSALEVTKKEKGCENHPNEKTSSDNVTNTAIIENVGFENDETCTDVKQNRRWWSCLVCGTRPEKAKQNKTKANRRGLLQRILHVFRG